jgi:hypothetical protein
LVLLRFGSGIWVFNRFAFIIETLSDFVRHTVVCNGADPGLGAIDDESVSSWTVSTRDVQIGRITTDSGQNIRQHSGRIPSVATTEDAHESVRRPYLQRILAMIALTQRYVHRWAVRSHRGRNCGNSVSGNHSLSRSVTVRGDRRSSRAKAAPSTAKDRTRQPSFPETALNQFTSSAVCNRRGCRQHRRMGATQRHRNDGDGVAARGGR